MLNTKSNKSNGDLLVLISTTQLINHGWFETGTGSLLYQDEILDTLMFFLSSIIAFLQFCNGVSLSLPFKFDPIPKYINL